MVDDDDDGDEIVVGVAVSPFPLAVGFGADDVVDTAATRPCYCYCLYNYCYGLCCDACCEHLTGNAERTHAGDADGVVGSALLLLLLLTLPWPQQPSEHYGNSHWTGTYYSY